MHRIKYSSRFDFIFDSFRKDVRWRYRTSSTEKQLPSLVGNGSWRLVFLRISSLDRSVCPLAISWWRYILLILYAGDRTRLLRLVSLEYNIAALFPWERGLTRRRAFPSFGWANYIFARGFTRKIRGSFNHVPHYRLFSVPEDSVFFITGTTYRLVSTSAYSFPSNLCS